MRRYQVSRRRRNARRSVEVGSGGRAGLKDDFFKDDFFNDDLFEDDDRFDDDDPLEEDDPFEGDNPFEVARFDRESLRFFLIPSV